MNLLANVMLRLRRYNVSWEARVRGRVRIDKGVYVAPGAELLANRSPESIDVGAGSTIHRGTLLQCYGGHITIGENVGINLYCVLYGHGGLEIGNDVLIATGCVMIPANHNFQDSNVPIRLQGLRCRGIKIHDDVWIGARVTILDGVMIGRGAVIGTGAVVAKSIPAGAVAVGVPARVADYREGSTKDNEPKVA